MKYRPARSSFSASTPSGKRGLPWAAASAAALACSITTGGVAIAAEETAHPVSARLATVAVTRIADIREVAGTVHARNTATVAAQVIAAVREITVRAGDSVKTGQLLARLDDAAAAAEYRRADADRRRYEALLSRDAATRAEYEAVITRFRIAEAELGHTRVTAPMDGLVTQRFVDPGDMATPGKALFVVEQADAWRLEIQVPERLGGALRIGDAVRVHMDAAGDDCPGKFAEIVPMADAVTRSFTVKIDLTCPMPLRSGAFGRALLPVDPRDAIVVPAGAVRERGQLRYVFVDEDGHARMRLVRTGRSRDSEVEVLAGLAVGDRVVVAADGDLVDGCPLTAAPQP